MFDIVTSFGDRLILETARRFRTQVRPDHPLAILTSDQGMTRMAMAEGMDVFFFQARAVPQIFGKRLTGALFHPFKPELYTVSLVSVLWELAVSFGCLQLSNPETETSLELWGIVDDKAITWQPLHAKEDLLWGRFHNNKRDSQVISAQNLPEVEITAGDTFPEVLESNDENSIISEAIDAAEMISLKGAYKFSPGKMLDFIGYVQDKSHVTDAEGQEFLELTRQDIYKKYKNFLRSGHFLSLNGENAVATDALKKFWKALIREDTSTVLDCLLKVPSFERLYEFVQQSRVVKKELNWRDYPIAASAVPNYLNLGESATAWLEIPNVGVVCTKNRNLGLDEFADVALASYENLKEQEKTDWILTGQWLETIAMRHGIHPVVAQKLVEQVRKENYLRVYAEGSTPDTRFELHTMWVLKTIEDKPRLVKVYLYHGEFLIPGTASVRIKIQGVNHAT